jgi:hypothetical protein
MKPIETYIHISNWGSFYAESEEDEHVSLSDEKSLGKR